MIAVGEFTRTGVYSAIRKEAYEAGYTSDRDQQVVSEASCHVLDWWQRNGCVLNPALEPRERARRQKRTKKECKAYVVAQMTKSRKAGQFAPRGAYQFFFLGMIIAGIISWVVGKLLDWMFYSERAAYTFGKFNGS